MSTATAEEATTGPPTYTAADAEIQKWNWGAFLWTVIWTLGHRLWWQSAVSLLLIWIPLVGIVVSLVLGAKGNEWAWKRGSYASVEDFRRRERRWVKAWFVTWGVIVLLIVIGVALA